MSKPAARMGDMTAHGGTITLGQPTVLIGGQPAARATDMHVCPLSDGPKPHVGGPIAMGSAGVLIGGLPAARVGDMVTCAGPPDTIVMGCPTVLIGEVAGGGAGGGGGGGGGAAGAQASAATAQFDNNESTTLEEHWVEFKFVDKAGLPVSGVPYTFEDPDDNVSEGTLRLDGTIRRDDLSEGQCKVVLKDVFKAEWDASDISTEDKVKLKATTEGFEDGTPAQIQVFERDLDGVDAVVADLKTKVDSNKVEATWRYEYPEEASEEEDGKARSLEKKLPVYSDPRYYFEVIVQGKKARSAMLEVTDFIEIELEGADGEAIGNVDYVLTTGSGEVRKGTLDGSGYAREDHVPPADCVIRFPALPDRDAQADEQETDPLEESGGVGVVSEDGPVEGTTRFQIFDAEGEPLGGAVYTLDIDGRIIAGSTDRKGWTEPFETEGASSAQLEIGEQTYEIQFVDQLEGLEGVQARLNALGFNAGPVDGEYGPQTRSALIYYQEARYLKVTGEPDERTLDALKQEFGG